MLVPGRRAVLLAACLVFVAAALLPDRSTCSAEECLVAGSGR